MSDSNQIKSKSRKRKILLEREGYPSPHLEIIKNKSGNLFSSLDFNFSDVYRKNRFVVQLEKEGDSGYIIPDSRISKFNLSNINGENRITIEAIITVDEWVEQFLNVTICRLYLLNSTGEIVKNFDYDISNAGYEYQLDHNCTKDLSPKFFYTIF